MAACIEHAGQVRLRLQMHRLAGRMRPVRGRVLSSFIGVVLLVAALPFIAAALLRARLHREPRFGKLGSRFTEYTLVDRHGKQLSVVGSWPRLINVIRGDVALVGPAVRDSRSLDFKAEANRRVTSVEPGLICSWWIRRRTNIAYSTQIATDLEYLESRSLRTDLGIVLRALLSLAYGGNGGQFEAVPEILGLPLDNVTLAEAVDETLRPAEQTRQVSFVNVDCVNKSRYDREYRRILQKSSLRLADGIGLRIAGKLLRSEIRQNVNGTDLFPFLCEKMRDSGLSLFLLGGRPGVADAVAA